MKHLIDEPLSREAPGSTDRQADAERHPARDFYETQVNKDQGFEAPSETRTSGTDGISDRCPLDSAYRDYQRKIFREARAEKIKIDRFHDRDLGQDELEAMTFQADDPTEIDGQIRRLLTRVMYRKSVHRWEVRYVFGCSKYSAEKIMDRLTDAYPELITRHCPICEYELVARARLDLTGDADADLQ